MSRVGQRTARSKGSGLTGTVAPFSLNDAAGLNLDPTYRYTTYKITCTDALETDVTLKFVDPLEGEQYITLKSSAAGEQYLETIQGCFDHVYAESAQPVQVEAEFYQHDIPWRDDLTDLEGSGLEVDDNGVAFTPIFDLWQFRTGTPFVLPRPEGVNFEHIDVFVIASDDPMTTNGNGDWDSGTFVVLTSVYINEIGTVAKLEKYDSVLPANDVKAHSEQVTFNTPMANALYMELDATNINKLNGYRYVQLGIYVH